MTNAVAIVNNALKKIGTPAMPVVYEEAVKALEACITLDEAKYFSDKAEALAAWAKIYRNDAAGRKAKQLKLHAYRRMGILAGELRPTGRTAKGVKGFVPGAYSLLREQGLSDSAANAAKRLSVISKRKFDVLVGQDRPPSPSVACNVALARGSDAWKIVCAGYSNGSLAAFRAVCRRHKAKELARQLTSDEVEKARAIATECAEWIDEFLQHLPKPKKR